MLSRANFYNSGTGNAVSDCSELKIFIVRPREGRNLLPEGLMTIADATLAGLPRSRTDSFANNFL